MRHLHGVMHDNKWMMFQGLLDIVLGPSRRRGFHVELGVVTIN